MQGNRVCRDEAIPTPDRLSLQEITPTADY